MNLVSLHPNGPPCLCTSDGTMAKLLAAIHHEPEPLCPLHQADAIKARETEAERAKHQDHADRTTEILEQQAAAWNAEEAAKAAAQQTEAINSIANPLERSLALLVGSDNHVPTGSPLSAFRALDGFRELTPEETRVPIDTDPFTPGDLPPAA